MEAKLVVAAGNASKTEIPLELPAILGRGRQANLTIAHPMISRKHCQVSEENGVLMIEDLGSLNGTLVGGQRVRKAPLPPATEFTIGPLTFRVEYEYQGDLAALPPPVLLDDTTVDEIAPGAVAPPETAPPETAPPETAPPETAAAAAPADAAGNGHAADMNVFDSPQFNTLQAEPAEGSDDFALLDALASASAPPSDFLKGMDPLLDNPESAKLTAPANPAVQNAKTKK